MKAAGIGSIRKELTFLPANDLHQLCQRLIQFQKNNKELATYFLFYQLDEPSYRKDLKYWLDEEFALMANGQYLLLRSIKKVSKLLIIRLKCTENKQTQTELFIYFVHKMESVLRFYKNYKAVENLFASHVNKAIRAIEKLHEDLQSQYSDELKELTEKMGYSLKPI